MDVDGILLAIFQKIDANLQQMEARFDEIQQTMRGSQSQPLMQIPDDIATEKELQAPVEGVQDDSENLVKMADVVITQDPELEPLTNRRDQDRRVLEAPLKSENLQNQSRIGNSGAGRSNKMKEIDDSNGGHVGYSQESGDEIFSLDKIGNHAHHLFDESSIKEIWSYQFPGANPDLGSQELDWNILGKPPEESDRVFGGQNICTRVVPIQRDVASKTFDEMPNKIMWMNLKLGANSGLKVNLSRENQRDLGFLLEGFSHDDPRIPSWPPEFIADRERANSFQLGQEVPIESLQEDSGNTVKMEEIVRAQEPEWEPLANPRERDRGVLEVSPWALNWEINRTTTDRSFSIDCELKGNTPSLNLERSVFGDCNGVKKREKHFRICGNFDAPQVFEKMPLRRFIGSDCYAQVSSAQLHLGNWVFDPGSTLTMNCKQYRNFGGLKGKFKRLELDRLNFVFDPGARFVDSFSYKDHEVLVQKTNLSKLLDACANCGGEKMSGQKILAIGLPIELKHSAMVFTGTDVVVLIGLWCGFADSFNFDPGGEPTKGQHLSLMWFSLLCFSWNSIDLCDEMQGLFWSYAVACKFVNFDPGITALLDCYPLCSQSSYLKFLVMWLLMIKPWRFRSLLLICPLQFAQRTLWIIAWPIGYELVCWNFLQVVAKELRRLDSDLTYYSTCFPYCKFWGWFHGAQTVKLIFGKCLPGLSGSNASIVMVDADFQLAAHFDLLIFLMVDASIVIFDPVGALALCATGLTFISYGVDITTVLEVAQWNSSEKATRKASCISFSFFLNFQILYSLHYIPCIKCVFLNFISLEVKAL